MKKFKIMAVALTTCLTLSCAFSSCSRVETQTDSAKTAVKKKDDKNKMTANASAQSMPEYQSPDFPTPESAIDYLEKNADTFFPKIKPAADILKKVMEGAEPTAEEIKVLEDPSIVDSKFMDATLMLMQWTEQGKISEAQNKQLEEFSAKHKEGMENLGVIIQAAMISAQAAQTQGGAMQAPAVQ